MSIAILLRFEALTVKQPALAQVHRHRLVAVAVKDWLHRTERPVDVPVNLPLIDAPLGLCRVLTDVLEFCAVEQKPHHRVNAFSNLLFCCFGHGDHLAGGK